MSFHKAAVPSGIARSRWQYRSRCVVCGCHSVNQVAKPRAEPCAVGSVLGHDLEVELAEVEQSKETFATEHFVAHPRTGNRYPSAGQERRRSFADHRVKPDPVSSQLADVESLARGEKAAVSISPVGEAHIAVHGTE